MAVSAVTAQLPSSSVPVSWAKSDSRMVRFTHKWTVQSFAACLTASPSARKRVLESGPFTSGQPDDSLVWCIRIECSDRFGWIRVALLSGAQSAVAANFNCYIIGSSQQKWKCITQQPSWRASHQYIVGQEEFLYAINRSVLNDQVFLPNGHLTLYFEIEVQRPTRPQVNPPVHPAISDGDELGHDLCSLLKDGLFSDVTVVAGGKEFKAHKNILSARSPVFRAMFEHDMRESTENRVTIEDISPGAVEEMLRFIYSGQAPNLKKMPVDLLRAAEKYDLKQLKAWSEKELANRLTPENVMEMMVLADQLSATELKTVCMNLFTTRAREVVKTEGWAKFAPQEGQHQLMTELVSKLAIK